MRFPFGVAAVLALAIPSAVVRAQVPLGPEFRVDGGVGGDGYPLSRTTGRGTALSSDGDFMVLWTVDPPGGPLFDYDVFARRFGGDSRPRGPAFRLNVFATGEQEKPSVAH